MTKSKNKTAAREWREDAAAKKYADERFERERERLRYAGCKRHEMPDPEVFEKAGYPETAAKIRQALRLLSDAHSDVQHVRIGDDDD